MNTCPNKEYINKLNYINEVIKKDNLNKLNEAMEDPLYNQRITVDKLLTINIENDLMDNDCFNSAINLYNDLIKLSIYKNCIGNQLLFVLCFRIMDKYVNDLNDSLNISNHFKIYLYNEDWMLLEYIILNSIMWDLRKYTITNV